MNQEVREFQTKISGLTSRNVELESANSSLQKRMADLLKEMEDKEANFRNEMARKVGYFYNEVRLLNTTRPVKSHGYVNLTRIEIVSIILGC